jgi:cytochrome c-type biogenesis protein CcmH/NrfG
LKTRGPELHPGRNFLNMSLLTGRERREPQLLPNVSFLWEEQRMEDRAQVLTPTEARQASPRRLNFRVLVVSMVLAIAVAAILYYAVYSHPNSAIGVPDEPAATDSAEPPAP